LAGTVIVNAPDETLTGLSCAWFGRRIYDRARLMADPTARVDLAWVGSGGGAPAPSPAE